MAGKLALGTTGASASRPSRLTGQAALGVGTAPSSQALGDQIDLIASRSATILIEGETGVGKEVAARQIHARSRRADRPFIPVDCTAFSTELMESQLFGHVKGAFTGAVASSLGFVRCADGGTLFLDEIGELPLTVQSKLLRCLQERTVVPVGGAEPIAVNVRFVAATHRDLAQMVREGTFRQDLYFRLNVVRLTIRPLRERREDILPLATLFLAEVAECYEELPKVLAPEVEDRLLQHDWPGNVRELRNAVERAFLYCGDRTIQAAHLPTEIQAAGEADSLPAPSSSLLAFDIIPRLADAERMLIARALTFTNGNQSDTARLLDIERHRLRRKIILHGLEHLARIRPR